MVIRKSEYESLQEQIAELKAELRDVKKQYIKIWTEHTNEFLKDYEYALLLPKDSYVLQIWNDGRFEKGVREVNLHQEIGSIPELHIEK